MAKNSRVQNEGENEKYKGPKTNPGLGYLLLVILFFRTIRYIWSIRILRSTEGVLITVCGKTAHEIKSKGRGKMSRNVKKREGVCRWGGETCARQNCSEINNEGLYSWHLWHKCAAKLRRRVKNGTLYVTPDSDICARQNSAIINKQRGALLVTTCSKRAL